ncbi:MAG: hypothetical protein IT220_10685 [Flavobacteriaceae bacterium]|nr:hypothetical protein [Flavobacteriaceae bacterium]
MKKIKLTILIAFIALCCLTNGIAQEAARGKSKGKVVMTGRPGSIVVFGGGTSMPSSDGKDKAFLSNTTAINADVFLQLKRWTPVLPKPHTSIGLNIGAAYNFGGSGGFGTTPNPFAVTGQTSSVVSDKGTDPAQAGFRMGAGPQVNFQFGKLIISPMVLGEYFSMIQNERSSVQTTQFNGQSYEFTLASMPKTKTSGFAVTPKLRLHYMFNDRFGLFADASYTMGSKTETVVSTLIPNGNPQTPGDTYNLQQLQTGSMVNGEPKSVALNTMGINFGVVIGLGGQSNKASDGKKHFEVTAKANTDDIKKGWNGLNSKMVKLENSFDPTNKTTQIEVKTSGQTTKKGEPIVAGGIIQGKVSKLDGKRNSGILIKVRHGDCDGPSSDCNDRDTDFAITDEEGNFTLLSTIDTIYIISVEGQKYGAIKIINADSQKRILSKENLIKLLKNNYSSIPIPSEKLSSVTLNEMDEDDIILKNVPCRNKAGDYYLILTIGSKSTDSVVGVFAPNNMFDSLPSDDIMASFGNLFFHHCLDELGYGALYSCWIVANFWF